MTEQIELEGTLNIYDLAKLYHIKRPGIWRHNVRKTNKHKCFYSLLDFSREICSFSIVVVKFSFVK